ncbi:hypothetical protein [Streptomyces sp. NRRL B-24484]|uniref:hypothetical protein n=1 Tax=Streptomyces sp. NRRL B-24484 TaxID=1463833 RepID=UPI0004BECB2C|nr:hypothetical protein [Streptomyces sp. NRRL B-24484]
MPASDIANGRALPDASCDNCGQRRWIMHLSVTTTRGPAQQLHIEPDPAPSGDLVVSCAECSALLPDTDPLRADLAAIATRRLRRRRTARNH